MGSWQTSVVKSDTLLFLPKIRCPGAAFHRTGAFQCSLRCRMESAPSAHEVGSSNTGRYEKPVHRDAVNRFLSCVGRKDTGFFVARKERNVCKGSHSQIFLAFQFLRRISLHSKHAPKRMRNHLHHRVILW